MRGITETKDKTVGYLLKEIRKKYCLDQKDICGGNVKRSKIAKIEINDPTIALTEEYAKEIAHNINSKIKKYDEEVDYLYFFDNTLYNVKQEALDIQEEIQMYFNNNDYNSFKKIFYRFINEYSQYNIPAIKLKVFTVAAMFYNRHKEYHISYIYYTRAVDNAIATKDQDELIKTKINLCVSLILLEDYEEAIKYLNQMLSNKDDNLSNQNKYLIYYTMGHAYLKLKDYTTALIAFEEASIYVNGTILYHVSDLFLQKAYCYRFLEKLSEAIEKLRKGIELLNGKLYEELKYKQDMFGDKLYNTKLCLIKNIISAYRFIGDTESMEVYIEKLLLAMDPIIDNRTSFIIDIYIDLFDDYIYLENYNGASSCIVRAFDICKQQNNFYYQNQVLKKMFTLYKQRGEKDKIKELLPEVKSLLTKYPDKTNNDNVAFTYFEYYFKVDKNNIDNVICEELLSLINKEE